jgi:hypothetical protein
VESSIRDEVGPRWKRYTSFDAANAATDAANLAAEAADAATVAAEEARDAADAATAAVEAPSYRSCHIDGRFEGSDHNLG